MHLSRALAHSPDCSGRSLENVDGADGTLDLPLLVGLLHCHHCRHNHVGEEFGITAGHWAM